jgi:hypothetical protein
MGIISGGIVLTSIIFNYTLLMWIEMLTIFSVDGIMIDGDGGLEFLKCEWGLRC